MHHPRSEIPTDLLGSRHVLLVACNFIQCKADAEEGRGGFFINTVGVKCARSGKALALKFFVIEIECTDCTVEILLISALLVSGNDRKNEEATYRTLLCKHVSVIVPGLCKAAVIILTAKHKVATVKRYLKILGLVNADFTKQVVSLKVAGSSRTEVAGIVLDDHSTLFITLARLANFVKQGLVFVIAVIPTVKVVYGHRFKGETS